MRQFEFKQSKFEELVLYVISRSGDDPSMGATKLNKILFYSDFLAYANHGAPITGASYQRLPYGPAPRQLIPARDRLVAAKDAVLVRTATPLGSQDRLFALRQPRLNLFDAREIALVDSVMEWLRYHSAEGVSTLSHREVGWQITGERETIPYETVFISDEPLSDVGVAWARSVAERTGHLVATVPSAD